MPLASLLNSRKVRSSKLHVVGLVIDLFVVGVPLGAIQVEEVGEGWVGFDRDG
jgi:uncharacterized protein YcbK (DUF882 family)